MQKTSYELRISDWRSDVCSSDLPLRDDVRRMISSGPIHIVMAGDLDVEQAVKTVASTFGALPPRPPYNPPAPGADQRSFGTPTSEPLVLTHNGLNDQSLDRKSVV